LSVSYALIHDWDKATYCQEQSILHAKQLNDREDKIKKVFDYLSHLGEIYSNMGKLPEAKAVGEEAYLHVSEVDNPEHPLVLEAGGKLIEMLNATGDFYDAERFARVCYEALTRGPLDPDCFEAARAAMNLANASCNLIIKNGPESADFDEAEMLARKAVRIVKELKGPGSNKMIIASQILFEVTLMKRNFIDETKNLLEDYFNDTVSYDEVDGESTGCANHHL
jgi:hypothetical protein